MEDIRKTWFQNLSKEDAVKGHYLLDTVFEGGAIAGGLSYSEMLQVVNAKKEFKELTGLNANDVLDSFVEYGYCYGNDYIPESYFPNPKEGE